jgi:translocation and assembly module TamB
VRQLALRSSWLNADLDGSVELAEFYRGNLGLEWQWTDLPSTPLAGKLLLRGDLRRYELEHTLSAPQRLITSGSFSYLENALELDLENEWDAIQWQLGESLLRARNGSLRLNGNLATLDVALETLGRIDDLPETRLSLVARTDLESIELASLCARNELGTLNASGSVGLRPLPVLDLEYTLSDLDPSLASERLQGQVDAIGRATGSIGEETHELTVVVSSLGGHINGQPLTGNAEFMHSPGVLKIADSRVRLGSNRASVRGEIGNASSLDATLEAPVMEELGLGVAGNLVGSLHLRNLDSKPEVNVEANGADLAWSGYTSDALHVVVAGSLDEHLVRAEARSKDGNIEFDANGAYADGNWAGVINALSLENTLAGKWSMHDEAELSVGKRGFSLSRACLLRTTDSGKACAAASLEPGGEASFDVDLNDLPLAALPVRLPPDVALSGFGNVKARGTIRDGRVAGTGELNLREARLDAIVEDERISAVLADATGQANVADNRLVSTLQLDLLDGEGDMRVELTVENMLDLNSVITGRGKVALKDMSLVAALIPDIAQPRGVVRGNVDISGSLAQPEFLGEVSIADGAFGVRRAGIEIVDLNARVSQMAVGRLRLEGSARSGAGHIDIQGDTWVNANTGVRSELRITGDNFQLSRLPDWQVAASPSIEVIFDDNTTSVTGNLLIPSTNVRIKELPDSAVSPSPDALVHRQGDEPATTRRQVRFDVAVGLGEEVFFSGFGLSTGIEGTVRLRGGTQAPISGLGNLSLRDGTYKAYGQDLEIERGQLIFNGPLDNPQLDIRAVRRTRDVVAGIQIAGTRLQLRSSVFSEPPLRDAEALSYLLTGRPLAGATNSGDGDMLNSAAFALGVSGAANIVSEVRSGLGLETLTVEGGAEDGRLIAGKRIGDRLLVEYGYGLIDKLGTLLLRYQLTDRIVLESRTGTVSNFDILYKVKRK